MKNKKLNKMLTVLAVALLSLLVFEPVVLAWLSSDSRQGISIQATPVEQVWEVHGQFNIENWSESNGWQTGITVTNKTQNRELWVYIDFTGDMQDIFQAPEPLKIGAGQTVNLCVEPLNHRHSLQIPNPVRLCRIVSIFPLKTEWNSFSGAIVLHLLNGYDSKEIGPIRISGESLSQLAYGMPADNSTSPTRQQGQGPGIVPEEVPNPDEPTNEPVSQSPLQGADLLSASEALQLETAISSQEIAAYRPLELMDPVVQAIDLFAPGMLVEKAYFQEINAYMAEYMKKVSLIVAFYQAEVAVLQETIAALTAERQTLQEQLAARDQQIQDLQQQLRCSNSCSLAPVPSSSAPLANGSSDTPVIDEVLNNAEETAHVSLPESTGEVQNDLQIPGSTDISGSDNTLSESPAEAPSGAPPESPADDSSDVGTETVGEGPSEPGGEPSSETSDTNLE